MLSSMTFYLAALLALAGTGVGRPQTRGALRRAEVKNTTDVVPQAGYNTVGYFANWGVYGDAKFLTTDIQSSALTHAVYAFAGIFPNNGSTFLFDPWADVQMNFTLYESFNGTDMMGNMAHLYLQKKHNRNLKTLLSFGGWTMSQSGNVSMGLSTPEKRQAFAKDSVAMIMNLGFDGIDIDYEYPNSTENSAWLVETCQLIRTELDARSAKLPSKPHFLITLAAPAGAPNTQFFNVPELDKSVDFINLMSYDYMGSFSKVAGASSNLFASKKIPKSTDFTTKDAVAYYLNSGLPSEKLILGMPLYGHVFNLTDGPGTAFSNEATDSTATSRNYKAISLANETLFHDYEAFASWSYDAATRTMISFDDPMLAKAKVTYLQYKKLGGAMFWSLDADRPLNDSSSLVGTVANALFGPGGKGMAQVSNNLDYPDSEFANLRAGMPGL